MACLSAPSRRFARSEQATTSPTRAEQPHGRRRAWIRHRHELALPPTIDHQWFRPTVEPRRARARIEPRRIFKRSWRVVQSVVEHVPQGVPDFARSAQRPTMISIIEHRPRSTHQTIDRTCDSHLECAESRCARQIVRCLDDQMEVVRLDTEVNDPEVGAVRPGDRVANREHEPTLSQRREILDETQRDVLRNGGGNRLACVVPDPRSSTWSSGVGPPSTAPRRNAHVIERELWRSSSHVEQSRTSV